MQGGTQAPVAKTLGPRAKPNLISGGGGQDGSYAIDDDQNGEFILNVVERLDQFGTKVDRVHNTVELADFFVKAPLEHESPCYNLGASLKLTERGADEKTAGGLGPLLDELTLLDPDFVDIKQLSDLGDSNFETMEHQRPPGYSATTRVHMGRLCVPMLNYSGATCACTTEEQMVLLVNHL